MSPRVFARLRRVRFLRTFRGRLAALYVALEVSVLILAAMAMYFALRHAVTREIDQELSAQFAHLAEDLRETPAAFWPDRCRDFSAYFLGGVRVLDLQNRVLCE
ncbi:MAG: hypothetical protein D6771_07065, partial [Zetaproteobacteria bacterium]